jgi:osmotically inducible protein OsmC
MATTKTAEVRRVTCCPGKGTIARVGSGAISSIPVSWAARNGRGRAELTSPEGLIAAAHASCFSVAISNGLAKT